MSGNATQGLVADASAGAGLLVEENRRILIVDDNAAIHNDFRSILSGAGDDTSKLDDLDAELFGESAKTRGAAFELDSAYQGEEALGKVLAANSAGSPYALAFVDVRMPPGWDGVKTAAELLREDEHLCIVICSAYNDYSFEDLAGVFGDTDRVLILRKPFDTIEVRQLAHTLRQRWQLSQAAALKRAEMEALVERQTREIRDANQTIVEEAAAKVRMQDELRLAQKLEAVGQLAAGVAHEINTPVQFVTDNLVFLTDAWQDFSEVLGLYREFGRTSALSEEQQAALAKISEKETEADLDHLIEEAPQALSDSLDGVRRVGKIVRSLKEFAHPGGDEMGLEDINALIERTLTVAQSEYKHVAEVETELAELPAVTCRGGDISRVVLNLVVNSAHAIGDAGGGERGRIRIGTELESEDFVVITVADNGPGIPEEIRERIFDPFFTTKDVGKGTGQGLAMARAIVEKHGGTLKFDTTLGSGTTFRIRLPVEGAEPETTAD